MEQTMVIYHHGVPLFSTFIPKEWNGNGDGDGIREPLAIY